MFVALEGAVSACGCVCICDRDTERHRERERQKSRACIQKIPSGVASACRDEAWIFYLTWASSKGDTERKNRKEKKRLQLLKESVCLKGSPLHMIAPFTRLIYGVFVASVQLCNHVPGMKAFKGHSNQYGGTFQPKFQCGSCVSLRSLTEKLAYTNIHSTVQHTNHCIGHIHNILVSCWCRCF